MGLNNDFDRLRSQMMSIEPTPSLSKIFSLALQEEQQMSMQRSHHQAPTFEGAAFIARSDRNNRGLELGDKPKKNEHHLMKELNMVPIYQHE